MDGRRSHRIASAMGAGLLTSGAAAAQVTADVGGVMRVRHETAQSDDLARDAEALTIRTALEATFTLPRGFSATLEGEAVSSLVDEHALPEQGGVTPVILDPGGEEVNQALVAWRGSGSAVTVGRQRLKIGDERLVGSLGFRQNEQTFDAVRATQRVGRVDVDYAYIGAVRSPLGDRTPRRTRDRTAHSVRLVAPFHAIGTVSVQALLLDAEEEDGSVAVDPERDTIAVGLSDNRAVGRTASHIVGYTARYARQWTNGPGGEDMALDYWRGTVEAGTARAGMTMGVEALGGNGTAAFQTPLGTLHKFQGFADVFLRTPDAGVVDVAVGGRLTRGPLFLSAAAHRFTAYDGDQVFGRELDVVGMISVTDHVAVEVGIAAFDGKDVFPDQSRAWVSFTARFD